MGTPSLPLYPFTVGSSLLLCLLLSVLFALVNGSIKSFFQFLARTQLIWRQDSPFNGSNADLLSNEQQLNIVHFRKSAQSDEAFECAVCFCRIEEGEEIREQRCGHVFHRCCLDTWLQYRHRTCPLCRETLPRVILMDGVLGEREPDVDELVSEYSSFLGSNGYSNTQP